MDVYKTPESNVMEERKGNKIKAVLVGIAIDYGLTFLASVIAGVILSVVYIRQGVPESEIEQKIVGALADNSFPLISYPLIVFGLFASYLGGYFTAKISNDKEYLLAGILCLPAIILMTLNESEAYTLLQTSVLLLVNIAVIYLGAYNHVRNKR